MTTKRDTLGMVLIAATLVAMMISIYLVFMYVPTEATMGEVQKIFYFHVPSASLSMMVYVTMAVAAGVGLIWRIKLAHAVAVACAPIGASFTFLALATGSIWAKPIWGTWWVWDARLTSELVLLFLYFGYMAVRAAVDDETRADRASGLLAIIGVINIPIIKYSVEWWNTLHQPATISKMGKPSMDPDMLVWLLVMLAGYICFFAVTMLIRTRAEVIKRSRSQRWLTDVIGS